MRVAMVGLFSATVDEGFKKIASRTASALEAHHEIHKIGSRELLGRDGRARIVQADPEVIHIFSAPTLRSLAIVRSLRGRLPRARIVATTIHPYCLRLRKVELRWMARAVRPDVALTQSSDAADLFSELGSSTLQCPNGVDDRFHPVSREVRAQRKAELGFDVDRPLILHVGHLTRERNLERLLPLADESQVLVVTGRHFREVPGLRHKLAGAGVRVIDQFLPEIERVYQAADCYAFPVQYGGSIFLPLSVLEAAACGVPVVTMPYPSLSEAAIEGLKVAETSPRFIEECLRAANSGRTYRPGIPTWADVADIVLKGYAL